MRHLLSTIVAIASGAMLYSLTNAIPVIVHERTMAGRFEDRIQARVDNEVDDIKIQFTPSRTAYSATWGLSRLHGATRLPTKPGYDEPTSNWPTYMNDQNLGEGSRIYIIDTGVDASHGQFLGKDKKTRVEIGQSFGDKNAQVHSSDTTIDEDLHGTGLASAAAGLELGPAKLATIIPYKKLTKIWKPNDVADAINAAVTNFATADAKIGVINIGLPSEIANYEEIFKALKSASNSGMHVTMTANNYNRNPNIPSGDYIVVGSTNIRDEKSSFSSDGQCVDIYAPGEKIIVAQYSKDRSPTSHNLELQWMTGTSVSAPFVAGIIAVIGASEQGAALAKDPKKMKQYILDSSAKGKITGLSEGSHNRLLQSPFQAEINLDLSISEKRANGDFVREKDYSTRSDPLEFLKWLTAGWK